MQTELSLYHVDFPRLKGRFNGLRLLLDSQVIPLHIPRALYQTRRNGVMGKEQYQIIQQNPTSFLYNKTKQRPKISILSRLVYNPKKKDNS